MKVLLKFVFAIIVFGTFVPNASFGVVLSGNIRVTETSDTAAKAKVNAVNSARRQILMSILSNYADKVSLKELMENTSSDDLMNFISSSSVSNEQISSNTYSANIKMTLDNDAVKKWLTENNVQNWVPSFESMEKTSLFIVVPNGISDWAELKRAARECNIEIETKGMNGNQVIASIPLNTRTKFTATIREYGWRYADNSGVLQIWK